MLPPNTATDINETLSAPLGDMIAAVGRGLAEAQAALDSQTMQRFKEMYQADSGVLNEMRRLGFTPTWYRIPEAEADMTISLSVGAETKETGTVSAGREGGQSRSAGIRLYASPVDASYANKYDFKFEAVSHLKFKVVAVPPSPQAEATKVVPKGLEQKTYGDAKELLDEWEISSRFEPEVSHPDALTVAAVSPPPGTLLRPGQIVTLMLTTN